MISDLRILFVADLNAYSKGMGRVRALQYLDVPVTEISHTVTGGAETGFASITMLDRILWKLGVQKDKVGINGRLLKTAEQITPDIVWIEKGKYDPALCVADFAPYRTGCPACYLCRG